MLLSRRQAVLGLTGSALATASWSAPSFAATAPTVVTTIAQVADGVRIIAGEGADVTSLMGEGVDPHTYRQTRSDIVALNQADVIFYNGLYLEAQMTELLDALSEEKPVVAVAEGAPVDRLIAHKDYEGQFDPHVWMDVDLWSLALAGVRDGLIQFNPDHGAAYSEAYEGYKSTLAQLQDYVVDALGSVPVERRLLVTAHDAFGYFGSAYGFEEVGIQGLSTESEAGLQRIEEIVDLIVERELPAVFVETSVADRNVRALIEGAAAKGHTVTIGGALFSDAMGAPGTYEGTYIGMIDHNATTIARALGASVAAGGWQGKLGTTG